MSRFVRRLTFSFSRFAPTDDDMRGGSRDGVMFVDGERVTKVVVHEDRTIVLECGDDEVLTFLTREALSKAELQEDGSYKVACGIGFVHLTFYLTAIGHARSIFDELYDYD